MAAAVAVLCPTFCLLWSMTASVAAGESGGERVGIQLWCVAKNNADDRELQAALDWACGDPPAGGVDCSALKEGGVCFQPDDLQFHASFAFNEYYHLHSSEGSACDFAGTAALTQLDPSRSVADVDQKCKFPPTLEASNGSTAGPGPYVAYDLSGVVRLKPKRRPAQVMSFLVALAVLGV